VRALAEARQDLGGAAAAKLRIGLLPSLAEAWLPRLVRAWEGPVEIVEALADELEKLVTDGALDVALPVRRGLSHCSVACEPYMLFVGPAHVFAGRRSVAVSELDRQPFILRQCCERLGTGRRLLATAQVRVTLVAKVRQEATAAALVALGVGATLAPTSWQRPGLHAVSVSGLALQRAVAVIWKNPPLAKSAAGIARKLATQAGAPVPNPA
jgi:DNA-binding transcriptional LysR family regulator